MSCKHEKRTEREWRCKHGVCGHHRCHQCVEDRKAEALAPLTAAEEIEQLEGVIADAERRISELRQDRQEALPILSHSLTS